MGFDFSLDPVANFESLFQDAVAMRLPEPNAMALATSSASGEISQRTVLFKGWSEGRLTFYTNYESTKAQQMKENPRAALLFFWPQMQTQVRFSGSIDKLTRAQSEAYFATRPRLSQLGAWASHQSQRISSHQELEKKVQEFEKKFAGTSIPCPENWGGFALSPLMIEFWFGREGRLHERFVYERVSTSQKWNRYLKSP